MLRGCLIAALLAGGAQAAPEHWQRAGWYVLAPYSPGPGELRVDGAYRTLTGPYASRQACEAARRRATHTACRHLRRIPVVDPPVTEPVTLP